MESFVKVSYQCAVVKLGYGKSYLKIKGRYGDKSGANQHSRYLVYRIPNPVLYRKVFYSLRLCPISRNLTNLSSAITRRSSRGSTTWNSRVKMPLVFVTSGSHALKIQAVCRSSTDVGAERAHLRCLQMAHMLHWPLVIYFEICVRLGEKCHTSERVVK